MNCGVGRQQDRAALFRKSPGGGPENASATVVEAVYFWATSEWMFIAASLCDTLVASSQLHMRPPRHGVRSIAMAEVTSF